jgi:hypothetical protein
VQYNDKNYSFRTGTYEFDIENFDEFIKNPEQAIKNHPETIRSDEENFDDFVGDAVFVTATGAATAFNASSRSRKTQTNESPSEATTKQTTAANARNPQAAASNTASAKNSNTINRLKTTTAKTYVKGNRTGTENTIKIIRPNGNQKLINSKRVKEFVPNSKAKGGLGPVNYNKSGTPKGTKIIEGSKGRRGL